MKQATNQYNAIPQTIRLNKDRHVALLVQANKGAREYGQTRPRGGKRTRRRKASTRRRRRTRR